MEYIKLTLAFIFIIVASNVLVDASSSIAIKAKLSKSLIALTIVAFGTCAPELAISFYSVIGGNGDVALANVIGSCIINILLVIGIASIFKPIKLKNATIDKELPLLLLITTSFSMVLLMAFSKKEQFIGRISGIVLLVLFVLFCIYIYKIIKSKAKKEKNNEPKYSLKAAILLVILTLITIVYCSDVLVKNAVMIASNLGISEKVITMVVIVIGTSLPELVMTVAAAKKHEFEFALGNIIGSNIFNICVVIGLPITIFGGIEIMDFSYIDVVVVMLAALMLYFFSKSDKKLTKIEGILMLAIFIMYYAYILFF